MKRIFLCLAIFAASVSGAMAQSDQHIGSYKANDLVRKADGLMSKRDGDSFEKAQDLYKQAETMLVGDIDEAKTKGKNNKVALLYLQNAQLQNKLLGPELNRAQQGIPFDTLAFCTRVDNIINSFNSAAEYNQKPDAKGRVKLDPFVTNSTKLGIYSMLTYYYNCGAFMDAMGKKQESVDYFQKYVELPGKTPILTKAEADSVYKANTKIYSTARFNLALQNFYLKNWDKAIAACDEALKDTIGVHDLCLIRINSYGEKKDSVAWQQAVIDAYQRTGEEHFMQNLIYYYIQSNKIDEATRLSEKLINDEPNSKMAWFIKGAIELNVKKDYKAAIESCDKALAIDPDFKDALFNKGTAYINDIYDQTHSSNSKFKYIGTGRYITGKQSDGSYQKNKAIYDKEVAYVKSYYINAQKCMERVRELAPTEAKRWDSPLQMVYSALGMKDKAKEMDDLLDAANKASMAQ